ncbi:MAG: carbohydrate-binding family 9-like protein [bacterium]
MRVRFAGCLALAALVFCGCVEKDPDVPTSGRRPLTQAEKTRVKKYILARPPARLSHPVNADLDGKLVYLGLDTKIESVVPGKAFSVVHYWQVKQAVPGWKQFVHTNGPKLSDFRNFDHVPIFGLHPVSKWKPGDIIRDEHSIVLPKSTRYKQVDIYVGIWRGASRLKVIKGKHDGKNRVLAARFPVGPERSKRVSEKRYVVRRAAGKIVLDGKADEADWKSAPFTAPFVDSRTGKPAKQHTAAKLLWDDKFLYVFLTGEDDDVWASIKQADDLKMWTEQVFEIYVDADGSGAEYIELQVNPRGVVFDAYLPRPGQTQTDWQSGLKAKVVVNGTLDKRDDRDQGWQVELAIPLVAVKGRSQAALTLPPEPGHTWRANFFRTDKSKDGALRAWAWSPPLRSTFHALERFGVLVFGDTNGGTGTAKPDATKPDAMKPDAMKPALGKPPKAGARRKKSDTMQPMGGMK